MATRTHHARAGALALAGLLTLAGCAEDTDDATSPSVPRESAGPTAGTVEAFCGAKAAIDAAFLAGGPPDEAATPSPEQVGEQLDTTYSELYAELSSAAQEEVADEVDALVEQLEAAIEEGNEEFFLDEDFAAAEGAVDEYLVENCDYPELAATAADYEFDGLPSRIEPGRTAITLTNEGEEFHELLLFRINDDVDLSAEEIVMLPEEEAMTKISPPKAVVLAVPGQTATAFHDLEQGRYAIVCFIPKESTAENNFQGEGPPHVVDGMVADLAVGDVEAPSPEPTATSDDSEVDTSGSGATTSPSAEPTSTP